MRCRFRPPQYSDLPPRRKMRRASGCRISRLDRYCLELNRTAILTENSAILRNCDLAEAAEFEIAGHAPLALGLGLIAGAGKVRPGQTPVVGAFGGPGETGRADEALQRPGRVIRNVGG